MFVNLNKSRRESDGHFFKKRGWDKSPSLSIVFGLSSKTQWLSGLYYADFISFYSPTQLCGGGTTKSNSNELPISVPLSFIIFIDFLCYLLFKATVNSTQAPPWSGLSRVRRPLCKRATCLEKARPIP